MQKRVGIPVCLTAAALLIVVSGCGRRTVEDALERSSKPIAGGTESNIRVDLDSRRPAGKLSEYGLFQDLASQTPSQGVVPYQLNVFSFSDQAISEGFVYLPPGQVAHFDGSGPFDFPIGSILVQNIRFPNDIRDPEQGNRLIETRLLIHKNFGWSGVPYLWNEEGSDADRAVIGGKTEVSVIQQDGTTKTFSYLTPNMNQCKRCHVKDEITVPIGMTARNLNRMIPTEGGEQNQLDHWHDLGLLDGIPANRDAIAKLPDWHDAEHTSVDQRARAWLDANCAHCHSPAGPAIVSGLDLSFEQNQPIRFGVYKPPVAAGRGSDGLRFGILPGKPEESFLLRRVESTELGVMMPPLGRSLSDHQGSELLQEWITGIPEDEAAEQAALNPMLAYKDAIFGGDAERGKTLFHKTQKCVNCHRVGSEGGEVGPNLSDVGKRTKPDYLLESVVDPNANIVQGFQTEVVMTDDGRILTGVVLSEDQYELVVADPNNTHKISKEEIEERQTSPVSTMPSIANLLTVDQVRDLIAYLVTLQETPAGAAVSPASE